MPQLNDDNADLMLEVEGRRFGCHSEVLDQRCETLATFLKKMPGKKGQVTHASYDAVEAVLLYLYGTATLAQLFPPDTALNKGLKTWEVAVKFGVEAVADYGAAWLEQRIDKSTVCMLTQTASKYPTAPSVVRAYVQRFKHVCLQFIAAHHQSLEKTPEFFTMMGSSSVRAEVEAMLRDADPHPTPKKPDISTPATQSSTPVVTASLASPPGDRSSGQGSTQASPRGGRGRGRGTASLMHRLNQTKEKARPKPQPQQPVPSLADSTVHETRGHLSTRSNSPSSSRQRSPQAPSMAAEVNEPVYESVPVFHAELPNVPGWHEIAVEDPVYEARDGPRGETPQAPPSKTRGDRVKADETPPVGGSPARRLHALLASEGNETPKASRTVVSDLSPTPQPPVKQFEATEQVVLAIEPVTDGSIKRPWRLASCVEAHKQRHYLRDLMDRVDGGFLGSYLLADGKVDGPGYGVPLRFSTGDFSAKCEFRVLARPALITDTPKERSTVTAEPKLPSFTTSPSPPPPNKVLWHDDRPDDRGGVVDRAGEREMQQPIDSDKDSIFLQYCKLQQEVRVTKHELDLFKNDYWDWEKGRFEAGTIPKIEEERLRERIEQQKQQLFKALSLDTAPGKELTRLKSSMEQQRTDFLHHSKLWNAEKERLQKEEQELRAKDSAPREEVAALMREEAAVQQEIAKLENVKQLIETELRDNEQYEEYSKQYVRAVQLSESELTAMLAKGGAWTQQQVSDVLGHVTAEKASGEREARRLEKVTARLKKRIDKECHQIQLIRAFLDETERVHAVVNSMARRS